MRKIILNVAVSLDGFIEGPNGEYDWCFVDQDYGMKAFLDSTDAILFGRKSYELMERVEPGAYPGKRKYVFSRTLDKLVSQDYTLIRQDAESEIKKIRASEGKNIWLFGGASLTTTLMNAGLIDELILSVHPIILGSGKSLFSGITKTVKLDLTGNQAFSTGLVQLFYGVLNE